MKVNSKRPKICQWVLATQDRFLTADNSPSNEIPVFVLCQLEAATFSVLPGPLMDKIGPRR